MSTASREQSQCITLFLAKHTYGSCLNQKDCPYEDNIAAKYPLHLPAKNTIVQLVLKGIGVTGQLVFSGQAVVWSSQALQKILNLQYLSKALLVPSP